MDYETTINKQDNAITAKWSNNATSTTALLHSSVSKEIISASFCNNFMHKFNWKNRLFCMKREKIQGNFKLSLNIYTLKKWQTASLYQLSCKNREKKELCNR